MNIAKLRSYCAERNAGQFQCPLSRVKRTSKFKSVTSAFEPMSRSLLNIAKRSLLRLMLSCVGLASKHAAGGVFGLARFQGGT